MDFMTVFNQMIILLILMIIGFVCFKVKLITKDGNIILSRLVLYVTNPALIIHSILSQEGNSDKGYLWKIFGISLLAYILLFIIAKLIVIPLKKDEKGPYEAMLDFANIGFIGIPVITSLYGNEAMIYVCIFMIYFNIFIFSYGIYLIAKSQSKMSLKKLINPGIIASVLAVILYLCDAELPYILDESISYLSAVTVPLAMIVIGATVASYSLIESIKGIKVYVFCLIKLIVLPVIMWAIFYKIVSNEIFFGVIILLTAMPVGSNVTMIANDYNVDTHFISKGTLLTTILSVVTIPIIAWLLL